MVVVKGPSRVRHASMLCRMKTRTYRIVEERNSIDELLVLRLLQPISISMFSYQVVKQQQRILKKPPIIARFSLPLVGYGRSNYFISYIIHFLIGLSVLYPAFIYRIIIIIFHAADTQEEQSVDHSCINESAILQTCNCTSGQLDPSDLMPAHQLLSTISQVCIQMYLKTYERICTTMVLYEHNWW